MGSIPFACIGVVVGLFVTGNKFGFMPGVGIVALSGVVVNDAIVLIDHINQLRRNDGMELDEALIQGGMNRFRAVLMTSITTIVGIFPLAIGIGGGSEFWGPLGWSIIFGLLFSTTLILMVVPAFYKLSEWLFCPKFYWHNDNALMRMVRIAMYISYGIGIAAILAAMTYFVLFTG